MKQSLFYFSLAVILMATSCARMATVPAETLKNADYGRAPTKAEIETAIRQFAKTTDVIHHTTFSQQTHRHGTPTPGCVALKEKDGGHRYEFGYLVYVGFVDPAVDHVMVLRDGKLTYGKPFPNRGRFTHVELHKSR